MYSAGQRLIYSMDCTGRNLKKRTFGHVRPAKIQISLHIRSVWSESSLDVF